VRKAGDIKKCVVLEDATIAKGIRRLVAVTGEEAFRVQQISAALKPRVLQLAEMPMEEREAALKAVGREIDETTLPLLDKVAFRALHAQAKKAFDDADKARKAAEAKQVLI
jgi:alanyl-tRNA synthetase